jgi:hypothetical protein
VILLRVTKETFVFQLAAREKLLLLELLKVYPQVPAAHTVVSKSAKLPDQTTTQRLLDEALAEQRVENKRQLGLLVQDPRRWKEESTHWLLSLSKTDIEWLLQVLNDIRVGSWVLLGSPEDWSETINPEKAPRVWSMELAGAFQMAFLHAMEGHKGSEQV